MVKEGCVDAGGEGEEVGAKGAGGRAVNKKGVGRDVVRDPTILPHEGSKSQECVCINRSFECQ